HLPGHMTAIGQEPSTPHGYRLDPALHRLLRSRPPRHTLQWVASAAGKHARVVRVMALAGGVSSGMHMVHVADADGAAHRYVLRRYLRADWLAEEPDAPAREATALQILDGTAVPAPRLVAADLSALHTDAPAVLMTALPGRVDWSPTNWDT